MQLSQRYETNSFKPHTSNVEVAPSLFNPVNLPTLQTEPGIRGKHQSKPKVSRNTKAGTRRSNTGNDL